MCEVKIRRDYSIKDKDISISRNKNYHYFDYAAEIAKKSTMNQKHGCIIVYKKMIIASGCNKMPLSHKESIHAEVNAINKAKQLNYDLRECDLYIVRIGSTQQDYPLKYSKPCVKCANYILQNKIKKAYYSLDETTNNLNEYAHYVSNGKFHQFVI
jgi:deoxycytidylate deaminase|tara:strand:+ start:3480 stop:3947 length:468 start_codon:yes stop_codon:yes gene_type:complete